MVEEEYNEIPDKERWELDQIIMKYWEAENEKERKKAELACYKLCKEMGFPTGVIDYLRENDAEELAKEMEHFFQVYQTVPHEHEKRNVA